MSRYLIIDTKASLGLNKDNSYDQTGTFRGQFLSEVETMDKFKEVFEAGISVGVKLDENRRTMYGEKQWDEFSKTL